MSRSESDLVLLIVTVAYWQAEQSSAKEVSFSFSPTGKATKLTLPSKATEYHLGQLKVCEHSGMTFIESG